MSDLPPPTIIDSRFFWPVDQEGYEVKRKRIVRRGGPLRWETPIASFTMLYLNFAQLPEEPQNICEFADHFGYLGLSRPARSTPEDLVGPRGEAIADWQEAITAMRTWVEIWKSGTLNWFNPANMAGLKITNLEANLISTPPDGRPGFCIRPASLRDAMMVQFAIAVAGGGIVRECRHCGIWFEAGRGRRRHAEFCSNEHKVTYHNEMKRRSK